MGERKAKVVTGVPMSKPLVLNTTNARATSKYAGLTAQFSQWLGKGKAIFQVYFTEDKISGDTCILYGVFDAPSEYEEGKEDALLERFATETEISLEYDPPVTPPTGMQVRPNGEYDKLRIIATSPFGNTRDLCAPVAHFREFIAWVP